MTRRVIRMQGTDNSNSETHKSTRSTAFLFGCCTTWVHCTPEDPCYRSDRCIVGHKLFLSYLPLQIVVFAMCAMSLFWLGNGSMHLVHSILRAEWNFHKRNHFVMRWSKARIKIMRRKKSFEVGNCSWLEQLQSFLWKFVCFFSSVYHFVLEGDWLSQKPPRRRK